MLRGTWINPENQDSSINATYKKKNEDTLMKLVNKFDSKWALRYSRKRGKRLEIYEIEQVIQQDHGIAFCLDHNRLIKNLDEGVSKHFFCVRIIDQKTSEEDWKERFDAKEESDFDAESCTTCPAEKKSQ